MINLVIIGNGNLGKACKLQILNRQNEFNLVGIFSRRESDETFSYNDIKNYLNDIDVALFCGGSSSDAPVMVPELNKMGFSTVDSYDNHGEIKNQNYINLVKKETDKSGTTAIIGAGWDPGYLSLQRIYNKAIMPNGIHNTFYGGKNGGMSMGHSNAVKKIPGVIAAHQITKPRADMQALAMNGKEVSKNDRHLRICYVVAESGKEKQIEDQLRNIEGYFKDQLVEVHFINMDVFEKNFSNALGHGGQIISADNNARINLELEMNSNPVFTANAMIAFGKANYRMRQKGLKGTFTIDEVAPAFLVDDDVRLSEI